MTHKFMIAAALSLSALAGPALAMGETYQPPKGNTPVTEADAAAMASFNACVSKEYVAGRNKDIDNAMGKYRNAYTRVTRSIAATNNNEFLTHQRSAFVHAADVRTTCTYSAPR